MHAPHPITTIRSGGYSADIRMFLHVRGESLPVVQSSSTEIKLKHPVLLEEGPAVFETLVDGKSFRSDIHIAGSVGRPGWTQIDDR